MRLIFFLCLLFLSVEAFAESEPIEINESNAFAKPLLIVSPRYPKNAPEDKSSVQIRIRGTVTAEGQLTSPQFDRGDDEQVFEDAINEVLSYWRFKPAVDEMACKTKSSEAVLLVWFEKKAGEPSVAVSMPIEQAKPASAGPASGKRRSYIRRPKPDYPLPANQRGIEGNAAVLMTVNSEGDIVSSSLYYSLPIQSFGDSLLYSLRRAKFSAVESSATPQKAVCITQEVVFCLSGGADFPSPYCRDGK